MQPTSLAAVSRAPFDLQLRPEDAIRNASWLRACAEALTALRGGQPFAVVGLPGTGKTFLLRHLTQLLASEGLHLRPFEPSQPAAPAGGDDIVLVDEADRLPDATLDRLCGQAGPLILAGLPELARRLADQPRPVATVLLEPLSPEDVARFVAARLSATGHKRDLFEAEAVLALAQHSAGLPRLVVRLAGAAMFLREHEGWGHVTRRHVDEAAAMRNTGDTQDAAEPMVVPAVAPRDQEPHPVPFLHANRIWLGLGGAAVLALLGLVLVSPHAPSPMPAQPQLQTSLAGPAVPPAGEAPPAVAAPASTIPADAAPPVAAQSLAEIPPSAPPRLSEPVLFFQGPILNETMNQGGRLVLHIHRLDSNRVTASFQASAGLIGSGDLTGTMTPDGRITASGRLMMGRNPFDTTLSATITGNRLEGTAVFSRPDAGSSARSRFSLLRS